MKDSIIKTYRIDGDVLEVTFEYNKLSKKHLGKYPDFIDNPRHTPNGRKWVDAITEDCPFADGEDKMCGTCSYMLKQDKKDIVGVCGNDKLKTDTKQIV